MRHPCEFISPSLNTTVSATVVLDVWRDGGWPRPGRMGFVRKRPKRPTLRFVAL